MAIIYNFLYYRLEKELSVVEDDFNKKVYICEKGNYNNWYDYLDLLQSHYKLLDLEKRIFEIGPKKYNSNGP